MNYVVEVLYEEGELAELDNDGMTCQEHFVMSEEIRDTNYVALSLFQFGDMKQSVEFADERGSQVFRDCVVCDLEISIGSFDEIKKDHMFLVNPFEIRQEQIPEVLEMWHNAKGHMVGYDGFLNARLFRSKRPQDRYGLVNISQWVSGDKFKKALGDQAYQSHKDRSLNYQLHPSLCIKKEWVETRKDLHS